jgi:diguanylate cyclase (GGDEF)-like protein/PAS domain S-box-containing protein
VRTREQLGVFEQRYRSLVEQVPAVAYVAAWDPDAPLVYVAPQIEDMLGFPPERWVEEPDLWERRLHPEDREAVIDGERRAFEEEAVLDREFRMVAADGAVVWVWERDTIVRGHDGRPSHTEGVLVDITERKKAEARAQHYLDVAGTILVVLNTDETVSLLNRHGRELLGRDDLIGRNWYDEVVPEADRPARRANFRRVLSEGGEFTYHQGDVVTHDGEHRTIAWRNTVLHDEDGTVVGTLSSGEDITERLRAEEEISRLAYFDPLTGLPNRTQLEAEIRRCVGRAGRQGSAVALLLVDLDNFKLVNDSFGHAAGDRLLRRIAGRLRGAEGDGMLARLGGDEFLVLVREIALDGAEAAARETLDELGLDPAWLSMELTESATLREPERIGPILRELSDGGLRLAIDDFGAGWSSLSRLRMLPVQTLKIDRSFMREIPENPEAGAIVRAVIALADALGMATVAEGVETRVQALFLAAQGCRHAQGRYFGEPVPAEELTSALQDALSD